MLTFGVGWFLQTTGMWRMEWATLFSFVLIALGVGLLASARTGRHKWPIALGALLTVILLSNASINLDFPGSRGGMGDLVVRPDALTQSIATYEHRFGDVVLDLTDTPVPELTKTIVINQGFGDVVVTSWDDVPIEVVADNWIGDISIFGQPLHRFRPQGGPVQLRLLINVGLGDITVRHVSDPMVDLPGRRDRRGFGRN